MIRMLQAASQAPQSYSISTRANWPICPPSTSRSAGPILAVLCEGSGRNRREQIVGCREAAKLVAAERLKRPAIGAGEIVADDDRLVQRLGDRFDPADEIDGGTDHGEIQPVGGADIAVDRRADMKGDDDLERRFVDQ